MPHSPRVHGGRVWLLHSGTGRLVLVDPASGTARDRWPSCPATRAAWPCTSRFAFVGPVEDPRDVDVRRACRSPSGGPELKCGVGVVDLDAGRPVAHLEFLTGVEEIFDVQVLPGVRCPIVSGPLPDTDGTETIWDGAQGRVRREKGVGSAL